MRMRAAQEQWCTPLRCSSSTGVRSTTYPRSAGGARGDAGAGASPAGSPLPPGLDRWSASRSSLYMLARVLLARPVPANRLWKAFQEFAGSAAVPASWGSGSGSQVAPAEGPPAPATSATTATGPSVRAKATSNASRNDEAAAEAEVATSTAKPPAMSHSRRRARVRGSRTPLSPPSAPAAPRLAGGSLPLLPPWPAGISRCRAYGQRASASAGPWPGRLPQAASTREAKRPHRRPSPGRRWRRPRCAAGGRHWAQQGWEPLPASLQYGGAAQRAPTAPPPRRAGETQRAGGRLPAACGGSPAPLKPPPLGEPGSPTPTTPRPPLPASVGRRKTSAR